MSCGLSRPAHAQAHLLHSGSDAGVPRGMACIAAFLLAVLGPGREEDAFWTFAGLLENRVPASCVLEVSPTSPTMHMSDAKPMRSDCLIICLLDFGVYLAGYILLSSVLGAMFASHHPLA